jgi:bacteriocin-like protein
MEVSMSDKKTETKKPAPVSKKELSEDDMKKVTGGATHGAPPPPGAGQGGTTS